MNVCVCVQERENIYECMCVNMSMWVSVLHLQKSTENSARYEDVNIILFVFQTIDGIKWIMTALAVGVLGQ